MTIAEYLHAFDELVSALRHHLPDIFASEDLHEFTCVWSALFRGLVEIDGAGLHDDTSEQALCRRAYGKERRT